MIVVPETVVKTHELSASLGGRTILEEISIEAKRGEITVIIGGSGCGKTTLLKHLIGLYAVRQGRIEVLGRDLHNIDERDWSELYQQIGVMYQNGALLNSMTVGDNVCLPLEQHTRLPMPLRRRVAHMKLQLVGLGNVMENYPSELSGGMIKRAALARAIVMDPPLLLCDEPGAGLDPQSLQALDRLLLNLRDTLGISIILVTHELASIRRLADRLVFLDAGRVLFQGSLTEADRSDQPALRAFFEADSVVEPESTP